MNGIRIVAIVIAIAISFSLNVWFSAPWYVSLPSGFIGYLVTRYVGWAINERRRLHREMDRLAAKVSRGEPLD
jgi:hypothetical protein